METRSAMWFSRNVRQVCERGFERRGMRRATVRCETSNPSLSSSPWMRGAPQRGLASAMVRTSWAISAPIGGRPVRPRRDFQVQKARKPCRCQRITVSGRTTWSASRHPAHWLESHTRGGDRGARIAVASIGGGAGRAVDVAPGSRARGRCGFSAQRGGCPTERVRGTFPPASLDAKPQSSLSIEFWLGAIHRRRRCSTTT